METVCEQCAYYVYDEEWDGYLCTAGSGLDEDDMARLQNGSRAGCPCFRFYDEYTLVQKQNG